MDIEGTARGDVGCGENEDVEMDVKSHNLDRNGKE